MKKTLLSLFLLLLAGCGLMRLPAAVSCTGDTSRQCTPPVVPTPRNTAPPPTPTSTPYGPTQVSSRDGMTQMFVPAGSFEMGMKVKSDIGGMGYLEAYPGHTVTLDAFWIDQTEVTNKMFAAFIAATGYTPVHDPADSGHVAKAYDIGEDPTSADWQHPNGPGTDITAKANNPVVQVSWNDAFAYCAWAGRRLPTEAEWEKSARDKNGGFYPWGNDANNAPAHYYNYALPWDTVPVGSYPAGASPYGALDMAGNVYEWVNDWYAADFYASLSSWTNPTGPASSPDDQKGVRGGTLAFYNPVFDSVYRDHRGTGYTSNILGFRCATGASSAMSPH